MKLNVPFMIETFLKAMQGVPVTMGITAVALVLAAPLAWLLAISRLHDRPHLARMAKAYTSVIRGTPIVLQILLVYSLLPGLMNSLFRQAGLVVDVFSLNPIYYAFVVFAINSSAGLSEIFRSSLAFIMTAKDVTAIARIEASYGYYYIEAYLVIFLIYILLCSLTQLLFRLAEKRAVRFKAA